ncbi:MAG: hypothetical protein ABSG53_27495 [Thermoguttaceae bacterium]|jgi:hypothetical protein
MAKPDLRLPGNVQDVFRQPIMTLGDLSADTCGPTIGPGSFDQRGARVLAAGFGDGAAYGAFS